MSWISTGITELTERKRERKKGRKKDKEQKQTLGKVKNCKVV